jgi:hypothetical protein
MLSVVADTIVLKLWVKKVKFELKLFSSSNLDDFVGQNFRFIRVSILIQYLGLTALDRSIYFGNYFLMHILNYCLHWNSVDRSLNKYRITDTLKNSLLKMILHLIQVTDREYSQNTASKSEFSLF